MATKCANGVGIGMRGRGRFSVQVSLSRRKSVRHVLPDHFPCESWVLGLGGNISRHYCMQERGGGRIAEARVYKSHIGSIVVNVDVVGLDVDSLVRGGRRYTIRFRCYSKSHLPQFLGGISFSRQNHR